MLGLHMVVSFIFRMYELVNWAGPTWKDSIFKEEKKGIHGASIKFTCAKRMRRSIMSNKVLFAA